MNIRTTFLMLSGLLAFQAAGAVKYNKPPADPGEHILLLNAIDADVSNSHLGATAFGNYALKLANDWNLPQTIGQYAARLLTEAGYHVDAVDIPADQIDGYRNGDLIQPHWNSFGVRKSYESWIVAQMRGHSASVVVVLHPYARSYGANVPVKYSGYGIGSTMGDKPDRAFIYANIAAGVLSGDPLGTAEGPTWKQSGCVSPVTTDAMAVKSLKDLTAADIAPYRSTIEDLARDNVRKGLVAAGLLRGEIADCASKGP